MPASDKLRQLSSELEEGVALSKCKKCGCMKGALEEIKENLKNDPRQDAAVLRERVEMWLSKTGNSLYT